MFVFTEPISSGRAADRPRAEHAAERRDLDRIAQRRAGAVRLDVVDVGRPDARRRPSASRITASWAGPLGAVSPLLAPSWLMAVPRRQRQHPIAVRHGVRQALEHDDAAALAAHEAVGAGVERPAAPLGRDHPRLREGDAVLRREDQVDAAGERHPALVGPQALARPGGRATSDEEHAVSTATLGPCSPSTYEIRPEATLWAMPEA